MTLDPQAAAFLEMIAGSPYLDTQSAEQNRADIENAKPLTGQGASMHTVEDRTVPGDTGVEIGIRVYRPIDAAALPAVVYFHGGGWVIGDLDLADSTTRDIALHAEAVVVSVDYRLAPEHPFPAALDDALAVTRWVLAGHLEGADAHRVAVAGDSAGGNLAAVVAQQLRGETGLRHQILIYPVTQARVGSTDSYREFGEGHFLRTRDMAYFVDNYAAGVDPDEVLLAPAANADLSGLPPATVITAECDPLCDEGEAYAAAMTAAGVEVTHRRYDGQVHPFVYLGGIIDDALDARRLIGAALRDTFSRAVADR